jgi:hypothetical protein
MHMYMATDTRLNLANIVNGQANSCFANPSIVRQFCHWLTIRDFGLTFDRNKGFRKRFTDIASADSSLLKAIREHGTKERRACTKLLLFKMEGMLINPY